MSGKGEVSRYEGVIALVTITAEQARVAGEAPPTPLLEQPGGEADTPLNADSDTDNLPDAWELAHALDLDILSGLDGADADSD
ncbi:MAG: hypothetical protein ACI9UA_003767, partial [Pseudoalteromonas tetraodonis]